MRLYLDTSVLGAMFDVEPPDRNVRLGYPLIDLVSPEEVLYE
jgi:hypothetical protein